MSITHASKYFLKTHICCLFSKSALFGGVWAEIWYFCGCTSVFYCYVKHDLVVRESVFKQSVVLGGIRQFKRSPFFFPFRQAQIVLTSYSGSWRVNEFSPHPPPNPPIPTPIPSCAWLVLKEGLEVAHRASLFSALSKATWADPSLPSVLRTQNPIRRLGCRSLWPVSWGEEETRGGSLIGQGASLWPWGLRCSWRKEVLPYFPDKVSFMSAVCWTNQVNGEAPSLLQRAPLLLLLQADSADSPHIFLFSPESS